MPHYFPPIVTFFSSFYCCFHVKRVLKEEEGSEEAAETAGADISNKNRDIFNRSDMER